MKSDDSNIDLRILFAGAGLLALAWVFWEMRDIIPPLAAENVTASTEFSTLAEKDDARIYRAFSSVPQNRKTDARLELLPNAGGPIRHTKLTVQAPTEAEALENLQRTTDGMRNAFAGEGGGELHVNAGRKATPVPNAGMRSLSLLVRGGAFVLALAGAGMIYTFARRVRAKHGEVMPDTDPMAKAGIVYLAVVLLFGLPLSDTTFPFLPPPWDVSSSWVLFLTVMAIPFLIVYALVRKMKEVKQAALWSVGRARITKSKIKAERHRFGGEASKVKNLPEVEYDFQVGGETFHGNRIGIGEIVGGTAEVEAALQRYPVGASVAVYYDPDSPKNCVLERDAPASGGCLLSFAVIVIVAGLAVVGFFLYPEGILRKLDSWFPQGAHPVFAIFFGVAGLMMGLSLWASRKMAARAARWPTAGGRVVASTTESYYSDTRTSSSGGSRQRLYEPVVEYAYEVAGREYHSAQLCFGARVASGSRDPADTVVARYPVGTAVEVRYDPQNPSVAVLEAKVASIRLGLALMVIFFVLAAAFGGAFR